MASMATTKGRRVAIAAGAVAVVVLAAAVVLGWKHLVFWYRFEEIGKNAQGFPEYKHRQTGIVMVLLPGGKFLMGAQKTDPTGPNYDPEAQDDEGPVHEVTLSPFLIGKYEVTQTQWTAILRWNPSAHKSEPWTGSPPSYLGSPGSLPELPTENISWDHIQEFEAKTGLTLPTEAQWEYACRAGTTTPFSGTGKLDDMGWFDENGGGTTHPVGKKAPNAFGLFDLHGNVWEWCEDVYDEGFFGKPEARENDPFSDTGSESRAIRGGSWGLAAWSCRSSRRSGFPPMHRNEYLGCRPAMPRP
jgi:formylglycine-generating enzyme required for sulfatase activity